MQRWYRHISAIAGRFFLIGFSAQIVLGLFWMLCNFGGVQPFGENALVPYHTAVYLLQLTAAFAAAYALLSQLPGVTLPFRIWGSLALITFPPAMQCHLAVLPDSLAASFLLLELAAVTRILRREETARVRSLIWPILFWLITALLKSEFLYLGAIPILVACIYDLVKSWKTDRRGALLRVSMAVASFCVILAATTLGAYVRPASVGSGEAARQSVSLSLAGRCVWPRVEEDYDYWPEEVRAVLSREEALQTDCYADNTERLLGKKLESALGEERAGEVLLEMAAGAWERHGGEILHDTVWDAAGYVFSPIVLRRQLTGRYYDSYSGRNYDAMRMRTPELTKWYVDYGCWWFTVGLLSAIVLRLARLMFLLFSGKDEEDNSRCESGDLARLLMYLFTFGAMTVTYTLRGAGRMDYKLTVALGIMWEAWMLKMCFRGMALPERERKGATPKTGRLRAAASGAGKDGNEERKG